MHFGFNNSNDTAFISTLWRGIKPLAPLLKAANLIEANIF